jgi:hypothetical protein
LTARTNHALIQTFTLNNSVNQLSTASRSGTLTVAGLAQGTPTSVTVKDNANAAQAATVYADQSFARAGISPLDEANTFTAVAAGRLRAAGDEHGDALAAGRRQPGPARWPGQQLQDGRPPGSTASATVTLPTGGKAGSSQDSAGGLIGR